MWSDPKRVVILLADADRLQEEAVFRALWARLPKARCRKAGRLLFAADRRLSLCGSALLAEGLLATGRFRAPEEIRLDYRETGQPYVPDHPDLFFSLSHSGHLAGCAFARKPIGFDLEHRRDGIAWADLLRWTQKESLGKYSGRGVFVDAGEKPAGIGYTRISVREGYLGMLCAEAGCSLSTHWSDLSGLLEGSC